MTEEEIKMALGVAAILLGVPSAVIALLVALGVIVTSGPVIGIALFLCFVIGVVYRIVKETFPLLFPDWDSIAMPVPISSRNHILNPPLFSQLVPAPSA